MRTPMPADTPGVSAARRGCQVMPRKCFAHRPFPTAYQHQAALMLELRAEIMDNSQRIDPPRLPPGSTRLSARPTALVPIAKEASHAGDHPSELGLVLRSSHAAQFPARRRLGLGRAHDGRRAAAAGRVECAGRAAAEV